MNILTWVHNQNGALQKLVGTDRLYSPSLSVKPILTFEFLNLQYIEQANIFKIDGKVMTAPQKAEVLAYINAQVVPIDWYEVHAKQRIESKHQEMVMSITGYVSTSEMATWQDQRDEAYAILSDSLAPTPTLTALVTARGITGETVESFALTVRTNVEAYQAAYLPVLGTYQGKVKQITAATTLEEYEAIVWN